MSEKRGIDIWKRKDDYIASRLDWLQKQVDKAQFQLLADMVKNYIGRFQVDANGRLKNTVHNFGLVHKIEGFFDRLDRETLRKVNTRWGLDMLKLSNINGNYFSALGEPKDIIENIVENVTYLEQSIGLVDGEIIPDGYLDQVTTMPEVRQDLKDYVTQSVNAKKGFQEYLRGLEERIKGSKKRDGAIEKYYKQFAYDTFNQSDAAVGKQFAEELDLEWFVYMGGTIDTSRRFCIKRANKTFHTEETEKWKCDPYLIGKPKGLKCDESYNPLIERGRYNCRHTIRYITETLAEQRLKREADEEKKKAQSGTNIGEILPADSEGYVERINKQRNIGKGSAGYVEPIRIKRDHVAEVVSIGDERILRLTPEGAEAYYKAIGKAQRANKYGVAVEQKSIESYSKSTMFITDDGGAGLAVTSTGDIVSVFKNPNITDSKKVVPDLMLTAVENGGTTLDCFDVNGFLPSYYQKLGFVPVSKVRFNKEIIDADLAEKGMKWPDEFGEPDIVFMVHNGDSVETIKQKAENSEYGKYNPDSVMYMEYGDAWNAQQEAKKALTDKKKAEALRKAAEDDPVFKLFKNEQDAKDYKKYRDEYDSFMQDTFNRLVSNHGESKTSAMWEKHKKTPAGDGYLRAQLERKMRQDMGYVKDALNDWQGSTQHDSTMTLKWYASQLEKGVGEMRYPSSWSSLDIDQFKNSLHRLGRAFQDSDKKPLKEQYLRARAFNQSYMNFQNLAGKTLYRGTGGNSGRTMRKEFNIAFKKQIENFEYTVVDATLTGYTDYKDVGLSWGSAAGGITDRVDIPRWAIFMHRDLISKLNQKLYHEGEHIVIGGVRRLDVRDVAWREKEFDIWLYDK